MSRKMNLKFKKGEKEKKVYSWGEHRKYKLAAHNKKYSMNATCREKEAKKVEHW